MTDNTLNLDALTEAFKADCKVIRLKYEYPGYTGTEKYAISQGRREIHQDRAGGLHSCDKKDEKVFENTLKFGLLIQSK